MGSRTKTPDRCNQCGLRRVLCICALIPKLELKTKVILLIHQKEIVRPTNTGCIAHRILINSEVRIRGKKGYPMKTDGLVEEERQSILLFPTMDANILDAETLSQFKKPLTLIIPDGNWRQASRMPNRVTELRSIPRFKLATNKPTEYKLRSENRSGGLATIEAIARALGIIEGIDVQEKMEAIFKLKVERTLWARAKIPISECAGGIPREAYD